MQPVSVVADVHTALEGRTEFVPVTKLLPADSPRAHPEDQDHIQALAAVETTLPPILVEPGTFRVIDGMHRLQAAIARGATTIEVEYFDGPQEDVFLEAVRRNISHGKPLTVGEREEAATRLLRSHYWMSDRSLAEVCGLSAKTVATLRSRHRGEVPELAKRVGRDGKLHPFNGSSGRREAARILRERPDASIRDVARHAGIAQATASDVRDRLRRGESPYARPARPNQGPSARKQAVTASEPVSDVSIVTEDRAITSTEEGRTFAAWLQDRFLDPSDWCGFAESIPISRTYVVARVARQCAAAWTEFAEVLEQRPHRK